MADRIDELEARMAWYEKQLSELDAVVRELYGEVARLRRVVEELEPPAEDAGGGHEKPPHY
jgi:uncharacterized coiled-coil protein SlyX